MSFIGYHAGVKKGFTSSVTFHHNRSGCTCFQMFVKSPRSKRLSKITDEDAKLCKEYVKTNNIYLVTHSGYFFNIATKVESDDDYTMKTIIDDLLAIEKVGGVGAVFHVGKHLKRDRQECLDNMFNTIKRSIDLTPESNSIFILETAAGCGTELCCTMEELGEFYNRFDDDYKKRVRICIDTCHVFAAGYDLRTKETVDSFVATVEENIGWNNVEMIHLNDSKKDVGCHVDRHENIGLGCIGKTGLKYFVKFCHQKQIPMILETPVNTPRLEELAMIKEWSKV